MSKVHIRMRAYNAKDTLNRAVDSILNQTHKDIVLYLIENGSTDDGETRKIVKEYARCDSRVVPFYVDKNNVYEGRNIKLKDWNQICDIEDGGCFCTLDADDEYALDFFEKAIDFMKENELDIVACGNERISAKTGMVEDGGWFLDNTMILNGEGFVEHFPEYLNFMRTIWGKMYSVSLLKELNFSDIVKKATNTHYGADTIFTLDAFRQARRVGILAGTHHKYFVYPTSVMRTYEDRYFASEIKIFEAFLEYLQLSNAVTPKNLDRIYNAYASGTSNVIKVVLQADISDLEKRQVVKDVLSHRYTKEALARDGVHDVHKLFLNNVDFDGIGE
ncbi:MAG: glycosyltransferase [Defluviitaleaceae bacterium]|nr:glycosyltransferase [Defluviitaleaceae bacterium]